MNSQLYKQSVSIKFSKAEALVFFDWLSTFNSEIHPSLSEAPETEQLLYDIEAVLERVLPEVVDKNYKELLLKAKKNLKSK